MALEQGFVREHCSRRGFRSDTLLQPREPGSAAQTAAQASACLDWLRFDLNSGKRASSLLRTPPGRFVD